MTWFRIDDSAIDHRKFVEIPRADRVAAFGAWAFVGTWCSKQLTDGRFPASLLEDWAIPDAVTDHLVEVGLWVRDGRYLRFHDWHDHQPSRKEVVERRAATRKRQQDWRDRRAESQRSDQQEVTGERRVTNESSSRHSDALVMPTRPDPSRPVPTSSSGDVSGKANTSERGPRKPASKLLPSDWSPTDAHRKRCAENGLDADEQADAFRDHHTAKASKFASWDHAFNNWLRNATKFQANARPNLRAVSGSDYNPWGK